MNDIRPKNPFLWVKYKILEWQWDLALIKSCCYTWEEYFLAMDPNFDRSSHTLRGKFCGYPHIAAIQYRDRSKREITLVSKYEIIDSTLVKHWLQKNCRGKYRIQIERMMNNPNTDITKSDISKNLMGEDYFFVGFTDERDYTMFVLRWK